MIDLHCYYSLSSPWAYLAGPQLQDIVRRHRVRLLLKPFDFQAVVPKTGGVPIRTRVAPRRNYHDLELARWSEYLGMPLVLKPRHYPHQVPADPDWNKYAGWMVIAAQNRGLDAFPLSHAILRAVWAEERDIAAPEERRRIADENGYDGASLLAEESDPHVRELYRTYSDEALALGVFGAPSFVLDGVIYWGQDRLGFVDRALAKKRAEQK
jgi:2-hydroxychromene-2-carboxylate isomerase